MSQATGGQAAPDHPTGTVRLTVQGNVMTVGLTPTVVVSGHPVRARFGTQDVPVWAGRNRVEAHAQWMRRYGQAALEFDVPPGAVVPVHYAVPWHQFTRGAMGHVKQQRRGVWVLGVLVAIPLLLVVMAVVAGVFAG